MYLLWLMGLMVKSFEMQLGYSLRIEPPLLILLMGENSNARPDHGGMKPHTAVLPLKIQRVKWVSRLQQGLWA